MPKAYTVKKDLTVRGLTFLNHGQQYSGWLPKGHYTVIGECTVNYSQFGESRQSPAMKLQAANGEHWYVALAVVAGE